MHYFCALWAKYHIFVCLSSRLVVKGFIVCFSTDLDIHFDANLLNSWQHLFWTNILIITSDYPQTYLKRLCLINTFFYNNSSRSLVADPHRIFRNLDSHWILNLNQIVFTFTTFTLQPIHNVYPFSESIWRKKFFFFFWIFV